MLFKTDKTEEVIFQWRSINLVFFISVKKEANKQNKSFLKLFRRSKIDVSCTAEKILKSNRLRAGRKQLVIFGLRHTNWHAGVYLQ